MQTTLCFTLTLLTFVTLAFVPNSFAQDASPKYVVRVTYFYPSDHEPSDAVEAKFEKIVKDAQKLYADEMEGHGFGRKTFTLETDENGKNVIHRIKGKFTSLHYSPSGFINTHNVFAVSEEVREYLDTQRQFISLVFTNEIEDDNPFPLSKGTHSNRTSIIRVLNFEKAGKESYNSALSSTTHELGHAFGLPHDFRDGRYIMYSNVNPSLARLSNCAAEWLSVSRYFNTTQNSFEQVPSIEMLEPALVSSPNTVRLRFEITHTKRLHQALLILYSAATPQLLVPYSRNLYGTQQCKSLSGNSETIDFITNDLQPSSSRVILAVIDAHGNFIEKNFPIDISSVLSDTASVPISIPDVNLETAIREELKLAPENPITNLDMLNLIGIQGNSKQITDLTGLEHATHLKILFLNDNPIVDFTPLTALKELNSLYLRGNQITDINPLAELTQLRLLDLSNNQIRDIAPLTGLTNLGELKLSSNPISDISPLAKLTQLYDLWLISNMISDSDLDIIAKLTDLQRLYLSGNQISDVRPLAKLTQLYDLWLSENRISDITPLANLTDLNILMISSNQITDVRPLEKLTNLNFLQLTINQISDVTPFADMVNLQRLYLIGNPIKNRKPLLTLLRKNPDIKIYLKHGGKPLPVTLSHFRAALTKSGVILNWTTESEVDNAGFYIYRSPTKDGEFKVVTPTMIQGAGTTGERNEYTWTDTTAKQNTVYYYRIEDVSHAGVREQLATVRLRGLVSASGKLTTRWADLKMQQ